MEDFIQKLIIYRFGLLHAIIIDNDHQFDNQNFREFCAKFYIMHKLISVGHPQSNSEAKVMNRMILHGIKMWLNEEKGL